MSQLKPLVDKLLTNVSSAFVPKGYVSELLFPKIVVKEKTGKLGKYGNSHLRIEHSLMGGRGKAKRVETITRSVQTYSVESHGLEGLVTPDDYRNISLPFDAEKDEVLGLSTGLWLGKEKAMADVVTNYSLYSSGNKVTLAGATQLSAYTTSDPIGVFKTARLAVRNAVGMAPNVAVMDWAVKNTLAYHPAILDALGFAQNRAGQLNDQELAKAMGVEKLITAEAVYNTAKEGQTDALSPCWGKHIVFAVLPEQAIPYQLSFGYNVILEDQKPRQVFKSPIHNPPGSTSIIVVDDYDHLISNIDAGYMIKDAIA